MGNKHIYSITIDTELSHILMINSKTNECYFQIGVKSKSDSLSRIGILC